MSKIDKLIATRVHDYYWQDGFPCLITSLKILGEKFNIKIDDLVPSLIGLNAGRNRTQCGLVQGPLLFIGRYGEVKHMSQQQVIDCCHKYIDCFTNEFGDIECRVLRPNGFQAADPPHLCENLTKKAVEYAARFMQDNLPAIAEK